MRTSHRYFSSSLSEENPFWDTVSSFGENGCFLLMEEITYDLFHAKLPSFFTKSRCFVLPSSQESLKTLECYSAIVEAMLEKGLSKEGCLIAMGGGSLLDLAGFVASTYARGIPFFSIPTTFLSMVDSCLGGKTALNIGLTKNVIGTFYPAEAILLCIDCLTSLPWVQWQSGLAEVIKHAVIGKPSLCSQLEEGKELFLQRDPLFIQDLILQSLSIKQDIIEKDPVEQGLRRSLNFGHTLGHAIESFSSYTIPHGVAVAVGMVLESYVSTQNSTLSQGELYRIYSLCKKYDLVGALPTQDYTQLLPFLQRDKKNTKDALRCTLLASIGTIDPKEGHYCGQITPTQIANCLSFYENLNC